ncbi:MAG: cysteine peptidase family C39 domain-containing protein [Patescibacteria group bacterium]
MHKIPYHKQETNYTCGAACMRMALEALGIAKTEKQIANLLKTNKVSGTRTPQFPRVAEKFKLDYRIERNNTTIRQLKKAHKNGFVIILNYMLPTQGEHYAVLSKIGREYIYLHDPWVGPDTKYPIRTFLKIWRGAGPGKRGSDNEKFWFFGIKK